MRPIDIPAIEEQARNLRAAEIHRINGLFAERAELLAKLTADSTLAGAHSAKCCVPSFRGTRRKKPNRCPGSWNRSSAA